MTRRLIAIFVLLSGLAALHAPAHASRLDDLSHDIETLAEIAKPQDGARCQCERPQRKRDRKCGEKASKAARPSHSFVLPASIIIGSDLALE
ncbi:MAG: hypothetical protein AAF553_01090 [Pseudomonadota bacterium]